MTTTTRPTTSSAPLQRVEVSAELRDLMRRLRLGQLLHTLPERLALARTQHLPHHDSSIPSNRGDFGCSDVERGAGLVVPALGARQAGAARVFLLRGRRGLGVQGAPKARRAQRDAKHPGGPRGDPVSFAGSTRAAAAQPPAFVCFVPRVGGWITRPAGGLGPVRSRPGCACRTRNACVGGCTHRSRRGPGPGRPPWWPRFPVTAARRSA